MAQWSVSQVSGVNGARTERVLVSSEIAAPPEAVWARVSDHEKTPSWVDIVKKVTIAREGKPRNGLGAIRLVEFKPALWTPVSEEIRAFSPPREFHYAILKGMPGLKDHLGKVIVDDLGQGRSRLRWEVDFVFKSWHPFKLFVPNMLKTFGAALSDGMDKLKAQFESSSVSAQ
jgi:hypothetical protein